MIIRQNAESCAERRISACALRPDCINAEETVERTASSSEVIRLFNNKSRECEPRKLCLISNAVSRLLFAHIRVACAAGEDDSAARSSCTRPSIAATGANLYCVDNARRRNPSAASRRTDRRRSYASGPERLAAVFRIANRLALRQLGNAIKNQ